jgi:hypothetical protein
VEKVITVSHTVFFQEYSSGRGKKRRLFGTSLLKANALNIGIAIECILQAKSTE